MSAIPDPLWHIAVGAVAGSIGNLAADSFEQQGQSEVEEEEMVVPPPIVAATAAPAVSFGLQLGTYDALLAASHYSSGDANLLGQIVRAIISGAAWAPLDVLQVLLEESPSKGGIGDDKRQQAWNENDLWWYQILLQVCVIRDVLFVVVCLPIHQALISDGINPFVAGALSGVIASLVSNPFHVIQERLQNYHVDVQVRQQPQTQQYRHYDESQNVELRTIVLDGVPVILPKVLPPPPPGFETNSTSTVVIKNGTDNDEPIQEASSFNDIDWNSLLRGSSSDDGQPVVPLPGTTLGAAGAGGGVVGESDATRSGGSASADSTSAMIHSDDFDHVPSSSQQGYLPGQTTNPLLVIAGEVMAREGLPALLFAGAGQRCIRIIPRIGTALAVHDALQETLQQAGWLTQHIQP